MTLRRYLWVMVFFFIIFNSLGLQQSCHLRACNPRVIASCEP